MTRRARGKGSRLESIGLEKVSIEQIQAVRGIELKHQTQLQIQAPPLPDTSWGACVIEHIPTELRDVSENLNRFRKRKPWIKFRFQTH